MGIQLPDCGLDCPRWQDVSGRSNGLAKNKKGLEHTRCSSPFRFCDDRRTIVPNFSAASLTCRWREEPEPQINCRACSRLRAVGDNVGDNGSTILSVPLLIAAAWATTLATPTEFQGLGAWHFELVSGQLLELLLLVLGQFFQQGFLSFLAECLDLLL